MNEDQVVTAKSAVSTIYLITEGMESEIEKLARFMDSENLKDEAAMIRATLPHRLESIDFLVGIIQDALEGAEENEIQ